MKYYKANKIKTRIIPKFTILFGCPLEKSHMTSFESRPPEMTVRIAQKGDKKKKKKNRHQSI